MISQIYYVSTTSSNIDDMEYSEGAKITDIWFTKKGHFLKQLQEIDEFLVTFLALEEDIEKTDAKNLSVKFRNATIQSIRPLTPSLLDEVVEADKSDLVNDIDRLLMWAFHHEFKSSLIGYLDKYPANRKYIGKLIHSYCAKPSYANLSIFLIKRYHYDIFKDNNLLFERAAMAKNANLCEMLLDECNALIPANVYNAFKSFGTKRFQHMWKVLRDYSDRVVLS